MKRVSRRGRVGVGLAVLAGWFVGAGVGSAALLSIEFVQDDQDGFDLWPGALQGQSVSTEVFATDPAFTSGSTTVTLTASTSFGVPGNRGSVNGTPPGYTYQHLYEDLLIATSPTGALTIRFSGLSVSELYRFSLYAWDPGDNGNTSAPVKEWTLTDGAGVTVKSVDWREPLLDNESYALVWDVVPDGDGAFELTNTDGLPQSAVNGFILERIPEPSVVVMVGLGLLGMVSGRRRC